MRNLIFANILHIEESKLIAKQIPNAKLVVLESDDHLWWIGNSESIVSEAQQFLTGDQPAPELDRVLATVLFTDIVGSTKLAAEIGDQKWKDQLETHNSILVKEIERCRGRVVKNTGDGYLATFDGPGRAIRCGANVRHELKQLGIQIRAGIHIGEIDLMGEDIGGIAVNIAARILSEANDSEVWVSQTVKDLVVGSGFEFVDKGKRELKGVPGEWSLYAVGA